MAVRKLKPTSAGRRFQTVSDFEEITEPRLRNPLRKVSPKRLVVTTMVVSPAAVAAVA